MKFNGGKMWAKSSTKFEAGTQKKQCSFGVCIEYLLYCRTEQKKKTQASKEAQSKLDDHCLLL